MPKLKITKAAVQKMPAPTEDGRQALYWDTELRGFGVLCSGTTNKRSFVVQGQVNGRSRRVTIGPTNVFSVSKAREEAQDLLAKMHLGIDPKEEQAEKSYRPMTLRRALDTHMTARKELRPQTGADYREFVERWLSDWLDKPLPEITPDMVEQRHLDIPKQVTEKRRQEAARRRREVSLPDNCGQHTANQVMRILRLLWNHAADRDDQLPPNPTRRLKRAWYPEQRREDHVKPAEMPAFYEAVCSLENPVHRNYMLLLLFTGLRKSEAAALSWDEVDFHEKVIRLPEARTKAKRRLDLPMSDFVRDLLVQRRAIGVEGPWVFPADSASGHLEEPRFALDRVRKRSGVYVTLHGLRRTFITTAESCDIPIFALKALVNHSMGGDVTAGYVMATPERLREPMQKVTDKLKTMAGVAPTADDHVVPLSGTS